MNVDLVDRSNIFLTYLKNKKIIMCIKFTFASYFSQSLFTLNLIEEFLSKDKVPRWDMDEYWCKNKNYFSKYCIS